MSESNKTIPPPTPEDMARDAEKDIKWNIIDSTDVMYKLQAWIRRAVAAESALATAREQALEDKERLDWLETQKVERAATWDCDPCEVPAFWRDPSVCWSISQSEKCGTYEFPKALKALTVREAIDTIRAIIAKGTP